jgi:hypothetical protein
MKKEMEALYFSETVATTDEAERYYEAQHH